MRRLGWDEGTGHDVLTSRNPYFPTPCHRCILDACRSGSGVVPRRASTDGPSRTTTCLHDVRSDGEPTLLRPPTGVPRESRTPGPSPLVTIQITAATPSPATDRDGDWIPSTPKEEDGRGGGLPSGALWGNFPVQDGPPLRTKTERNLGDACRQTGQPKDSTEGQGVSGVSCRGYEDDPGFMVECEC